MSKPTCEDAIDLNMSRLIKFGVLKEKSWHYLSWTRNDKLVGCVAVVLKNSATIRLLHVYDGKWVDYHVPMTFTRCHFGGQRPWFVCPCCHRRAGVLYMSSGGRFLCRRCGGFCYQTQMEQPKGRALIRNERLMDRIGGLQDPDDPLKPKGMHWKTYWRIYDKADAIYNRGWGRYLENLMGVCQ